MLSDVFYKRYQQCLYHGDNVNPAIHSLFTQVGYIIFEDLCGNLDIPMGVFTKAHRKLVREIGIGFLGSGQKDDEVCGRLLFEKYDLWNDSHGGADYFIKVRISLIELIFRELEEYLNTLATKNHNHR